MCIGIPEGDSVPIAHAYPSTMIFKAQSIVGVAVGDRKEAIECLDFAARGIVKVHYRVEKMEKLTDVSCLGFHLSRPMHWRRLFD